MSRPTSQRVTVPTDAGEMPAHLWTPAPGPARDCCCSRRSSGSAPTSSGAARTSPKRATSSSRPSSTGGSTPGPIDESADGAIEEAMGRAQRLDWPTTVADAVAALGDVRSRATGGTGVIGFCFGGGLAFNVAAVEEPDVLVSYYGSGIPGLLDLAPQVTAPSLHHFGTADSYLDAGHRRGRPRGGHRGRHHGRVRALRGRRPRLRQRRLHAAPRRGLRARVAAHARPSWPASSRSERRALRRRRPRLGSAQTHRGRGARRRRRAAARVGVHRRRLDRVGPRAVRLGRLPGRHRRAAGRRERDRATGPARPP